MIDDGGVLDCSGIPSSAPCASLCGGGSRQQWAG